jgi:hypothetical protein
MVQLAKPSACTRNIHIIRQDKSFVNQILLTSGFLEAIGQRSLLVFIKMAPNPQKGVLVLSYFALSFIRPFKNFAILRRLPEAHHPDLESCCVLKCFSLL